MTGPEYRDVSGLRAAMTETAAEGDSGDRYPAEDILRRLDEAPAAPAVGRPEHWMVRSGPAGTNLGVFRDQLTAEHWRDRIREQLHPAAYVEHRPASDEQTLRRAVAQVAAWCRGIATKARNQGSDDLAITAPVIAEEIDRALRSEALAYSTPPDRTPTIDGLLARLRAEGRVRGDEVTLVRLDGRKSGRVTIGHSRLPVTSVLRYIAAGQPDAEITAAFPDAGPDTLPVLRQLLTDLAAVDLARRPQQEQEADDELCTHGRRHDADCPDCTAVAEDMLAVARAWLDIPAETRAQVAPPEFTGIVMALNRVVERMAEQDLTPAVDLALGQLISGREAPALPVGSGIVSVLDAAGRPVASPSALVRTDDLPNGGSGWWSASGPVFEPSGLAPEWRFRVLYIGVPDVPAPGQGGGS